MKQFYTLLAAILLSASSFAQTPEKMSYQAIIRDAGGDLVRSTSVGMQISILQSSELGTVVYSETQTPITNINGLVSIEFGGGTNWNTIDWSSDSYFIKTETDPDGGSNYTIIGSSQLLSVPYAFHAKTAENVLEIKNLNIKDNLMDGAFLATFENTNVGDGDGIKIKLGKTHPAWDGSAYLQAEAAIEQYLNSNIENFRTIVRGHELPGPGWVLDQLPAAWITGTVCDMVDKISDPINARLGLPRVIGAGTWYSRTIVGINVSVPNNSKTIVPAMGSGVCSLPFPSFTIPNLSFVNVENTLSSENEFISFTDNEDRQLGYISATSVEEWFENYFDAAYLVTFIGEVAGIDALGAVTGGLGELSNLTNSYSSIGVEYGSGHGDYAEWLERVDAKEAISRGDIVAVKGGKITKNLDGAEQIMAVSEHPIILGNIPEAGTKHLGNNVAFMGQIPVKIMGPVATGDYIVGKGSIPGYGVAINPKDMTIEDFKLTVGRSWDENLKNGPKMVNTVVGVHNGDYFKILQKYEQKFKDSEARLDVSEERMSAVENKVNILLNAQNLSSN